ncbi:hypothetical protein AMAG_17051 [Allomyces macrogynus ATCC 38327]|uniref:Cwf19-like protein C-terminal domain-containing protein n=1 Tax=Allomyces macrogynus (strain ATCC 38327) TaxID=578462 RepID=A0A0L0TCM2_ALLM3|nr:hypothetical protein AMAG_17051 [Allomyces macrogynus ATCC 38327]|eukprot:KNE72608.1 hypothetical protein AMAG_17051 [Allomyces macrogynus ATCC 38327]
MLAQVQLAADAPAAATAFSSSPAPSLLPATGPADTTGTAKHIVLPTIHLRGRALETMLPSSAPSNADDMSLEEMRKRPENETKRKVAIDDYVRQQQSLVKCHFCFKDGKLPPVSIIAIRIRAHLALVPYELVRIFQKCLMRMYYAQGKAVLFTETVLDSALQSAEVEADEWTQHAAIIDTRLKPASNTSGFRRLMVPNLPYFHVWFDLDGGDGHVIEERARGMHNQFAREVDHDRVRAFIKQWSECDWTKMLEGGEY